MIHLFKNILLTYIETSVGPPVPKESSFYYIQVVDRGLTYVENNTYGEKRLFYAKNVTELFNEIEEKDFFLKIASLHSPLIIYADEVSFTEIFIRWVKGLFCNITYDGLFYLYHSYYSYHKLIPDQNTVFFNTLDKCLSSSSFLSIYWGQTKENIRGLAELYVAFKIPFQLKLNISLEIQLVQYIVNNSSLYSSSLTINFINLYRKHFMKEVCGVVKDILRNIYYIKSLYDKESLFLQGEEDIVAWLEERSELSCLKDEEIKVTEEGYSHFFNAYDANKCLTKLIELEKSICEHQGLRESNMVLDNPCIDYYLKNNSSPSPLSLIQKEIRNDGPFQLLKTFSKNNKFNLFLVHDLWHTFQKSKGHKIINELTMSEEE